MAPVVNVHEAKTQLSRLLEAVERGEDVVIARAGRPVARLVPATGVPARRPGTWKDRVTIADDVDVTPPEVIASFFGEDEAHR